MRTVSYRLADLSNVTISLGFVGENEHTRVQFDAKKIFEQYPDAIPALTVRPPNGDAYPAVITLDGDLVIWDVSDSDLAYQGMGEIQLVFTEGETVAKSYIARTRISRSIVPTGEVPTPVQNWIDQANEVLEEVDEAIPTGGTTGQVLAKKSDADRDTEWVDQTGGGGGTSNYNDLSNKPQIGGVTLSGNKTLHDLGAAAEEDIPVVHNVPAGGSANQVLAKASGTDYDLKWVNQSGGGGGGAEIDDTAGEGDTDVVWSAGKTWTENEALKEAIIPLQNSTATGVDLDVSDENGNVVLRIADGNVRTKNFISDSGIYESQFEYDNTAGTETITHFFPAGTRLAFHLTNAEDRERDGIADYSVTYKYTTPNGSTYTLGTAYGFNFPEYVLPNDAASVSVQYGTGLNWGSDATLSFKVYSIGSIPRQPHIITVGTGKDYTSIRAAVEYARQYADELNRYEIRIDAGTYDIMSYYTAEEIATEGFIGLMVSNGISLVGMGHRSEVILTATMSTSDYNETKRNWVSTLNIRGNTSIRNMTIKAENIRYAVHDDSSMFSDQNDTHIFDCVTFIGKSLTSSNDSDLAYGAGGANLKKLFFFNCEFSDALTLHTSDNLSHEYTAYFINCRARMMQFGDYNSGIPTHVYLENCSVAKIHIGTSGSHDQYMLVEGAGTNGVMISSPAGYVYALDGVHKFAGSNVTAGKGVKLNNKMDAVSAADSLASLYGISIGVLDGITYVQTEGWLNSNTLGLSNLSVGDYLTINTSTGAVEVGTASNAIAQVRHIDSNSVAYAKLV